MKKSKRNKEGKDVVQRSLGLPLPTEAKTESDVERTSSKIQQTQKHVENLKIRIDHELGKLKNFRDYFLKHEDFEKPLPIFRQKPPNMNTTWHETLQANQDKNVCFKEKSSKRHHKPATKTDMSHESGEDPPFKLQAQPQLKNTLKTRSNEKQDPKQNPPVEKRCSAGCCMCAGYSENPCNTVPTCYNECMVNGRCEFCPPHNCKFGVPYCVHQRGDARRQITDLNTNEYCRHYQLNLLPDRALSAKQKERRDRSKEQMHRAKVLTTCEKKCSAEQLPCEEHIIEAKSCMYEKYMEMYRNENSKEIIRESSKTDILYFSKPVCSSTAIDSKRIIEKAEKGNNMDLQSGQRSEDQPCCCRDCNELQDLYEVRKRDLCFSSAAVSDPRQKTSCESFEQYEQLCPEAESGYTPPDYNSPDCDYSRGLELLQGVDPGFGSHYPNRQTRVCPEPGTTNLTCTSVEQSKSFGQGKNIRTIRTVSQECIKESVLDRQDPRCTNFRQDSPSHLRNDSFDPTSKARNTRKDIWLPEKQLKPTGLQSNCEKTLQPNLEYNSHSELMSSSPFSSESPKSFKRRYSVDRDGNQRPIEQKPYHKNMQASYATNVCRSEKPRKEDLNKTVDTSPRMSRRDRHEASQETYTRGDSRDKYQTSRRNACITYYNEEESPNRQSTIENCEANIRNFNRALKEFYSKTLGNVPMSADQSAEKYNYSRNEQEQNAIEKESWNRNNKSYRPVVRATSNDSKKQKIEAGNQMKINPSYNPNKQLSSNVSRSKSLECRDKVDTQMYRSPVDNRLRCPPNDIFENPVLPELIGSYRKLPQNMSKECEQTKTNRAMQNSSNRSRKESSPASRSSDYKTHRQENSRINPKQTNQKSHNDSYQGSPNKTHVTNKSNDREHYSTKCDKSPRLQNQEARSQLLKQRQESSKRKDFRNDSVGSTKRTTSSDHNRSSRNICQGRDLSPKSKRDVQFSRPSPADRTKWQKTYEKSGSSNGSLKRPASESSSTRHTISRGGSLSPRWFNPNKSTDAFESSTNKTRSVSNKTGPSSESGSAGKKSSVTYSRSASPSSRGSSSKRSQSGSPASTTPCLGKNERPVSNASHRSGSPTSHQPCSCNQISGTPEPRGSDIPRGKSPANICANRHQPNGGSQSSGPSRSDSSPQRPPCCQSGSKEKQEKVKTVNRSVSPVSWRRSCSSGTGFWSCKPESVDSLSDYDDCVGDTVSAALSLQSSTNSSPQRRTTPSTPLSRNESDILVETMCEKRTRTVTFEDEKGDLTSKEELEESCRSIIDWSQAFTDLDESDETDGNHTCRSKSSSDPQYNDCSYSSVDQTCNESSGGDESCQETSSQQDLFKKSAFEACPCMYEMYLCLAALCHLENEKGSHGPK